MYTIVAILDENGEITGYWIIGPNGMVVFTESSFFNLYDDALDALINILKKKADKADEVLLNKLIKTRALRQKEKIDQIVSLPVKDNNDIK